MEWYTWLHIVCDHVIRMLGKHLIFGFGLSCLQKKNHYWLLFFSACLCYVIKLTRTVADSIMKSYGPGCGCSWLAKPVQHHLIENGETSMKSCRKEESKPSPDDYHPAPSAIWSLQASYWFSFGHLGDVQFK